MFFLQPVISPSIKVKSHISIHEIVLYLKTKNYQLWDMSWLEN